MPDGGDVDAEHAAKLELLRRRAARYAEQAGGGLLDAREVLGFRRGAGSYAVALEELREIRPVRQLSRIPGASAVVPGILHYRGEMLSAHDLEAFVHGAQAAPAPWALVVEHAGRRLALLADEVEDVLSVAAVDHVALPITLGERGSCFSAVLPAERLRIDVAALFHCKRFFLAF